MSDISKALEENLRRIQYEWSQSESTWRDETAVHFGQEYWSHAEDEGRRIADEARLLREVLERACHAALD